ncbi:metal ABC transporter permease [Nonlabens ponticola]|uniref:Metal ABC transporter permease n=1 Tax=Nonlabens ponticola TaxID=2496866 RepID=A0A3S9MV53_9FLAO|nr:metal ABC transporter permease [Nonlabens ponticola]AZQ43010.1 metal ABC transporter permease [Nonlabens ponticola]
MDITQYFTDYTLRTITLGTAVLGAICGMLGSFAVLRKESLLGDAISHAALPGIAVAFLLTGAKDSNILLLGALVSGLIGIWWIRGIVSKTHLKTDTALGLILSLFFGFGMLLLTYIQKQPNANQAGLDKYLFGQAATLVESDVILMSFVTGVSLITLLLFWKEFKLLLFDRNYAMTLGFNVKFIDGLISFFIVLAIVIGLQTVGVVLMSAMLLAPAAAARQWTDKLSVMVLLAAGFGIFAGVFGTSISASQSNLSTGPVIVLVASAFVVVSFIFSPGRGILFKQLRLLKNRRELELQKTLSFMYTIVRKHDDISRPHAIKILNNFQGFTKSTLAQLSQKQWITINGSNWSMTDQGFNAATNLYDSNKVES